MSTFIFRAVSDLCWYVSCGVGPSPKRGSLIATRGRYGMTTGQLLAAACAVLNGASASSGDAGVLEKIRHLFEVNGSAAAEAFFKATKDPYAHITRAVYPPKRDAKTPVEVFRSWCALRGGPDIEHGELVSCAFAILGTSIVN